MDLYRFLEIIKEKDQLAADLIKNFADANQSYEFIKKDKELRMKMKDVWEIELRRTQEEIKDAKMALEEYFEGKGIV